MEREKGIVALLLVLIALSISVSGWLVRVDHLVFDIGQRLGARPIPDDILIVAIDEESLGRIGRWPWSRRTHASLVKSLCAAGPVAIGLDIAFSEPGDDETADAELANAVAECGRVVLPMVIETAHTGGQVLESPPIQPLAMAAAGLGRVGVRLDEDGIARSVDLREGVGSASWPLFAEALLRVGGMLEPPAVAGEKPEVDQSLVRQDSRRLQFVGPPGAIPRVSYDLVLQGQAPPGFFAGKTVFVGATAVGLGDFLPTPVSADAQPMPGVEVQANIWLAMRDQRLIASLPIWNSALACALLALVPLLWLPLLMPLPGLLLSTLWVVALGLASALLPAMFQVWFAPTGALLAGFSAFPLWSWRRLETARRHLDQELRQLGAILPGGGTPADLPDTLNQMGFEQRIAWVQAAQRRMQQLEAQRNEALAFISHDLRSPLANAVQTLESAPECSSAQLLPSLRRAQVMAQDFLNLARAEALDQRQMKELELGALLHQAADEVYALARQRKHALLRQLPDDPVWVNGDFAALERCAINLLQNAVSYSTPETAISIGLDLARTGVRFWVENVGSELGADEMDRLFERFARGEKSASSPAGTGLGLYYVRTVAEKHGGSAGVDCTDGMIRFWIWLPTTQAGSILG